MSAAQTVHESWKNICTFWGTCLTINYCCLLLLLDRYCTIFNKMKTPAQMAVIWSCRNDGWFLKQVCKWWIKTTCLEVPDNSRMTSSGFYTQNWCNMEIRAFLKDSAVLSWITSWGRIFHSLTVLQEISNSDSLCLCAHVCMCIAYGSRIPWRHWSDDVFWFRILYVSVWLQRTESFEAVTASAVFQSASEMSLWSSVLWMAVLLPHNRLFVSRVCQSFLYSLMLLLRLVNISIHTQCHNVEKEDRNTYMYIFICLYLPHGQHKTQ